MSFPLRIVSFNLRFGLAEDGEHHWHCRYPRVRELVQMLQPDILCVQEAVDFQLDLLHESLPLLTDFGADRDGDQRGEHTSIFYNTQRFHCEHNETFWLTDTPAMPSRLAADVLPRICTWGQMYDRLNERPFYVFNTHLDHLRHDYRERGLAYVLAKMNQVSPQAPMILTGDFNAGEDDPLIQALTGQSENHYLRTDLRDSFRLHQPRRGREKISSFNGFGIAPLEDKIDYIFVTPEWRVLSASVVQPPAAWRYASDHFAVMATLAM